jgi:hypothetical protein
MERLQTRRRVLILTITDAVIAGEGDAPLAPTPIDLGMRTLETNRSMRFKWVYDLP